MANISISSPLRMKILLGFGSNSFFRHLNFLRSNSRREYSTLRQTWCNVDVDSDLIAFSHSEKNSPRSGNTLRALCFVGGGDLPLVLFSRTKLSQIFSVSPSVEQHHLTTLKLSLAISDLKSEDIYNFFSNKFGSDDLSFNKIKFLYEKRIAPVLHMLNPSAENFWNERICGRNASTALSSIEDDWRVKRHIQLQRQQFDLLDLLKSKEAIPVEVIEEGLLRSIPSNCMPTGAESELPESDDGDIYKFRAEREAVWYHSFPSMSMKKPIKSSYFLNLNLTGSPFPIQQLENKSAFPPWMRDDVRSELKQRVNDCRFHSEQRRKRGSMLSVNESGLFDWQLLTTEMAEAAIELSQYSPDKVYGFDFISTGEMLDRFDSAADASEEVSKLSRSLTTGGTLLCRAVRGGLNEIAAPSCILPLDLNERILSADTSPWYSNSSQHILAGLEDSL